MVWNSEHYEHVVALVESQAKTEDPKKDALTCNQATRAVEEWIVASGISRAEIQLGRTDAKWNVRCAIHIDCAVLRRLTMTANWPS